MSYQGTCTLSRVGENKYNLLLQDAKGRVLLFKRDIPFHEAVAEIENRMYMTEAENGDDIPRYNGEKGKALP